jgi:hypothetical protein
MLVGAASANAAAVAADVHSVGRDCHLQDFVTLQFIPPGTDLKPILPVLAKVFDQVGKTAGQTWSNMVNLLPVTADGPLSCLCVQWLGVPACVG